MRGHLPQPKVAWPLPCHCKSWSSAPRDQHWGLTRKKSFTCRRHTCKHTHMQSFMQIVASACKHKNVCSEDRISLHTNWHTNAACLYLLPNEMFWPQATRAATFPKSAYSLHCVVKIYWRLFMRAPQCGNVVASGLTVMKPYTDIKKDGTQIDYIMLQAVYSGRRQTCTTQICCLRSSTCKKQRGAPGLWPWCSSKSDLKCSYCGLKPPSLTLELNEVVAEQNRQIDRKRKIPLERLWEPGWE